MHTITSTTVVAATARANDITLFASLELSKSKWVVTINSPGSEKFSKHVIEGGDGAGLLDLLSRSRAKAEQHYGVPVKAIVIEEAPKKWSLSSAATSCGRSREVLHLLRFEHLHARPLPPRLAGREARAQQILDRQQGVALVFVGAGAAG